MQNVLAPTEFPYLLILDVLDCEMETKLFLVNHLPLILVLVVLVLPFKVAIG